MVQIYGMVELTGKYPFCKIANDIKYPAVDVRSKNYCLNNLIKHLAKKIVKATFLFSVDTPRAYKQD